MLCPKCHVAISDDAAFCSACGAAIRGDAPVQEPPAQVNTWLIPSILVTLCCCLPLGVVSLVFASKANSCVGRQDLAGAQQAAAKAKMWFWIAFVCGLIANAFWFSVQVLTVLADHAD